MATSINECDRAVQCAFEEALAIVRGASTKPLHDIETSLWRALLALGRALIALYLARVAARPRATDYVHDGAKFVLVGSMQSEIGTRFGKVLFERPVGRRVGWRRATCDRPVDRALGLCGGFSLATVMSVTRLCAQLAFGNARGTFAHFCEWSPSQRTTLRMVDAVGVEVQPFLQAAPAPEGDGEILVIQIDGAGAPHIDLAELLLRRRPQGRRDGTARHRRRRRRKARHRPRRVKGDKSKNAKVAFVGVIYTLGPRTDDEREGPINKRIYATFESHAALSSGSITRPSSVGTAPSARCFSATGQTRSGNNRRCGSPMLTVHRLGPYRREAVGSRAVSASRRRQGAQGMGRRSYPGPPPPQWCRQGHHHAAGGLRLHSQDGTRQQGQAREAA